MEEPEREKLDIVEAVVLVVLAVGGFAIWPKVSTVVVVLIASALALIFASSWATGAAAER